MNKTNSISNNVNDINQLNNINDNISNDVCKYCLQESKDHQHLVYPCDCKTGVHPSCLTSWINFRRLQQRNQSMQCELCKKNYESIELIMLIGNSIDNGGNLIESKYSERSINISIPNNNTIQEKNCGRLEIFFYGVSCSSLSTIFAIYIVDKSFENKYPVFIDFVIAIVNICLVLGFVTSIRRLKINRTIRREQRELQRNVSHMFYTP